MQYYASRISLTFAEKRKNKILFLKNRNKSMGNITRVFVYCMCVCTYTLPSLRAVLAESTRLASRSFKYIYIYIHVRTIAR